MKRARTTAICLAICAGCILTAAPAAADHHEPGYAMLPEDKAARENAMEAWGDQNPWHYDTYYLFGLTRGLEDTVSPLWGRIPLYPFTAVIDAVALIPNALGGLIGD